METNPNQKTIKVMKEECNKQHIYATYQLKALQYAMTDLKGETFKLWCYLGKNQDGHTFGLSRVDAMSWGIGSKSSYDRGVKELIEKGYLIETSSNHYDFYELPQAVKDEILVTIHKFEI